MGFFVSRPTSPVAILFSLLLLLTTILTLTWVALSQDLLPPWHFSYSSIDYNTYFDMGFFVSGPPSPVALLFFTSSIDNITYFDMGFFVSRPTSPMALLFFSLLLLLTTILTLTWVSLSQDLLPPWHFSSSSINYNTYFDMGFFVSGPPSPVALLFFFY